MRTSVFEIFAKILRIFCPRLSRNGTKKGQLGGRYLLSFNGVPRPGTVFTYGFKLAKFYRNQGSLIDGRGTPLWAVIGIEFVEDRPFQLMMEFIAIDLAFVFLEVFDNDEGPVDAEIDITFLAGQVEERALFAGRKRVK